jgi:hypothetical protein
MKAYKYHRYSYIGQISLQSMDLSETIIYIPELRRIVYNGRDGMGMKDYFGVAVENSEIENSIIKEAEEYIAGVKSGSIKHQVSDEETKDLPYAINPTNTPYALITSEATIKKASVQPRPYIKKIDKTPKQKEEYPLPGQNIAVSISHRKEVLYLSSYEELDLDISLEDVQKIEKNEQMLKQIQEEKRIYKSKFFK